MKVLEIAIRYGVDPRTVYTWIKKGCPCRRERKTPLGRCVVRLDAEAVQAWIDACNADQYEAHTTNTASYGEEKH